MMKVKPFSYHIPQRKVYTVICSNYSNINDSSRPSRKACRFVVSLCGVGTVLILVLFGFIGVAGQGKLTEMDESGRFSAHANIAHLRATSLSHKDFYSLSNLEEAEHENLQQKISLMGDYGSKYKNNSFSHNYSSQPTTRASRLSDNYQEYKLGVGSLLSPSQESMLSLQEDQRADSRSSSKIDGNIISRQPKGFIRYKGKHRRKQRKGQDINDDDMDDYSDYVSSEDERKSLGMGNLIEPTPTPNQTSNEGFLNAKFSALKSANTNDFEENNGDEDGFTRIRTHIRGILLPSGEDGSEANEDYDDDVLLERFIPGNSTHLSGKHKFRQDSQADVDKNDDSSTSRRRPRRSVVHLYDMVVCSTGCNPLIFKGYGCYCGFLGSGLTVDGIDKCCAKHDWCYHHAKCPPLLTYFVPYYWRCDNGRPQCVSDFRGWKGICGAHLCECDRQFAECLKKFPCPSQWHADPRSFPFAASRRPPRIPLLPYPLGRLFP